MVTPPSGAVNGDTYIRTLDNGEGYWQLRDGIWHEIGDMFSVYRVEAAETKIIPTNRQMVIHGELIIDGELEIEGELVLEL